MGTVKYEQPATNLTQNTRTWINGNRMIRKESEYYYEPCLGGKTGYTIAAGGTLVTYATIQDRVVTCVILKSKNSATAYDDSIKLYDYVNKNYDFSSKFKSTGKINNEKKLLEAADSSWLKTLVQNLKEHWIFVLVGVLVLLYIKKRIELERKRRARKRKRKRRKGRR